MYKYSTDDPAITLVDKQMAAKKAVDDYNKSTNNLGIVTTGGFSAPSIIGIMKRVLNPTGTPNKSNVNKPSTPASNKTKANTGYQVLPLWPLQGKSIKVLKDSGVDVSLFKDYNDVPAALQRQLINADKPTIQNIIDQNRDWSYVPRPVKGKGKQKGKKMLFDPVDKRRPDPQLKSPNVTGKRYKHQNPLYDIAEDILLDNPLIGTGYKSNNINATTKANGRTVTDPETMVDLFNALRRHGIRLDSTRYSKWRRWLWNAVNTRIGVKPGQSSSLPKKTISPKIKTPLQYVLTSVGSGIASNLGYRAITGHDQKREAAQRAIDEANQAIQRYRTQAQ